VHTTKISAHCKLAHPDPCFKVNNLQLKQAIEDLDVDAGFPELSHEVVYDEFAGLQLKMGIYCQHV
jgi:hypothetical protein